MLLPVTARIELPPKLVPVFEGDARYRGAYGGRGSAKTRSFAKMTAVYGYRFGMSGQHGQILCGREFMNSLDESSLEEVKAAIRSEPFLSDYYEIGEKYVRSRDRSINYTFAGLRHNVDSIKSKARILLCWVDEAEPVSETAWGKIVPTVREEGSEIWVTWNPESRRSATNQRFRADPPTDSKIIEMNWTDNPWFPEVLNGERLDDLNKRPDTYDHIWGGGFITAHKGAYYARALAVAKEEGRIGAVPRDPLLPVLAIWDIGGTGRHSDAAAIWIVQFVGLQVRLLDYYEARGQELSEHVGWLHENGYGKANCILPHDGGTSDKVYRVSYETALQHAGFGVTVVPNQGAGAVKARITAAQNLFPSIWFNEAKTEGGREALAWYHEKQDEKRDIGLGHEHDWASHGADAFGLIAIYHNNHTVARKAPPRQRRSAWAA